MSKEFNDDDGDAFVDSENNLKSKLIKEDHENELMEIEKTWKGRINLIFFVLFACFLSISVASKIRFTPVISHSLSVHFSNKFPQNQMQWLGRLYAVIVLCFLPISTAVVDSYKISYKFCLIISGLLQIIACITNSTVTHPLFFVLSDSLICGIGSTLAFSVFLLAIDDIFPKGNKFRVTATTLCQGSTIGSIFVLDFYAYLAHYGGWVIFQMSLAGIFGFISICLIITCPEKGLKFTVKNRINHHLNETNFVKTNKSLGLTFEEMQYSPSMFSWLIYRFIVNIIHQGIFILMLTDSHIILVPNFDVLLKSYFSTTMGTIFYGCGESFFYLFGAIFGACFLGYLLHINVIFIVIIFLLLVIWQPLRAQLINNGSMYIGYVICSGLAGCCVGVLNTCLIATAEEATMLRGRRIFPFMKLMEGLAYTLTPFLFSLLNKASTKNIWLLTFAVFAAGNACLMVYILHKLYNRYLSDSHAYVQVSMKPANFFTKGFS